MKSERLARNLFASLWREGHRYWVTVDGLYRADLEASTDEEAIERFFKRDY